MGHSSTFKDRREAGRSLARRLRTRGVRSPFVIAVGLGGLPVGEAVRDELGGSVGLLELSTVGGRPAEPGLHGDFAGAWPQTAYGRPIILVDDGTTDAATTLAAVSAVRCACPALVIFATPAGSREELERIASLADEVVCDRPSLRVEDLYEDASLLGEGALLSASRG